MSGRILALLVGINDYPANVGSLSGCVNDVLHLEDYLKRRFGASDLRIEKLLNRDATRDNVIGQIRAHLGQAEKDDLVFLQYSGHGARWKSAEQFRRFYPTGLDEGLVCVDSRQPGNFDLADKELAILLSEVASKGPHLAVMFDCCHSGSATRGLDDFTLLRARQTHEVTAERPLESYLDEYYSRQQRQGTALTIPASKHILLAACDRYQKAWEGRDHSGVFTSTLLEVLDKSGPDVSYADLFVRCRAAVRQRAQDQEPQFEAYQGFQAYSGFLGRLAGQARRRYSVSFSDGTWNVDCGAIHGLPTDPDKGVTLAVFPESGVSDAIGQATTSQVGAQKSQLALDFAADPSVCYQAEIASLPVPPLAIGLTGDAEKIKAFQQEVATAADESLGVVFLPDADGALYRLSADDDGCFRLTQSANGRLIQGARGSAAVAAEYLLPVVKQVAAWERTSQLQNHSTGMKMDDVQFLFRELLPGGKTYDYPDSQITLDYRKENGNWIELEGLFMVSNRSAQRLHCALFMLTEDYGVTPVYNEPVEPTEELFELLPDGKSPVFFDLDQDEDELSIQFKLIVSTEKVDDFLLEHDAIEVGAIYDPRAMRTAKSPRGARFGRQMVHRNEWFTKDLRFKIVRQLGRVTPSDTALAGQKITIKGHPTLAANVSLNAARPATRSVGDGNDLCRILEDSKLELINFSGTRAADESVLEITDIENPEVLAQQPLEIELDVQTQENEFILPVTFDGEDILLVGDPSRSDDGKTQISIREIPEIPDQRRSLGRALKLYFFKTVLGFKHTNQLCRVEYKADGSYRRHDDDVAEHVAKAKNIILLVHGIIGNTDSIVEGLQLAQGVDGQSIAGKFDLVLTYDYENLNTSISDTALDLKQQLAAVGLKENDGRRLTMLVHSMGGLVSRWFIEREGGNKVVDHLVMFGTPNVGSPFGMVDSARQLGTLLTTLAINSVPVFAPYGGAIIYALNCSKKLTPTLEQMKPDSAFITQLNESADPGIPYTIVAGDIRDYDPSTDSVVGRLLAKVGQGLLFDTLYQQMGHDIAVSDASIRGVAETRTPVPLKRSVVCHHLNYFSSPAGLAAMADVAW